MISNIVPCRSVNARCWYVTITPPQIYARSVANHAVTYLAVDIVTILATVEKISCELKWNFCYKLSILVYTFINIRFQPKVSSGYGPFHRASHGHVVIKQWIFILRIEPILENHDSMMTNQRLLSRLASARE